MSSKLDNEKLALNASETAEVVIDLLAERHESIADALMAIEIVKQGMLEAIGDVVDQES